MRAGILIEPGRLELVDVDRPRAGPGEVVLRVRAALTCGTDLKTFRRGHPKWPTPTPLGHEFAGDLAELGQGVVGFREGEAVMTAPTGPCGQCFWCRRRQENLCESLMSTMVLGGYAEYVKLPERVVRANLYSKPKSLAFAEAALLEPLACVLFGLEEVRIGPEDVAVLIGGGAITLLHLMALRQRGLSDLWVVTRNPRRAAAARALGARRVLEMDAAAAEEAVRAGTSGRGADLVIECTGRKEVWEVAPRLARKGGEVVLFGGCPAGTKVELDAATLHYDQVRIRSPFHFTPRSVRAAYELLAAGAIEAHPLFTATIALDGLPAAFRSMQAGEGIKYVVEP
ncbi:MAG: zinc-dependent alcohol dehydrogenase [Candidatus Binatia bacterium]